MAITRAKASSLLNQREMALYDDSRINGLRQLDARGLTARIGRSRTARDRARDLVQKHKLSSRARTGSKRGPSGQDNQRSKDKAALLADILKRFETRLKEVEREERAQARAATSRTPGRASTASASRSGTGRTAKTSKTAKTAKAAKAAKAGKTTKSTAAAGRSKSASARGAARGGAATSQEAASASKRNARKRRSRITPEQALAQTQALLEAKQARDQAPRPWQDAPAGAPAETGQPGFQSDAAARRALRLHAAEARLPAIQGSSSTRDRVAQGKRDRRGDAD